MAASCVFFKCSDLQPKCVHWKNKESNLSSVLGFTPPSPLHQAQGKVPPLAYHSCSMFRGELFVLGGVFPRPNPEPDSCSDSLYIFDPHLSIWYQPIVTGSAPSPRSG